MPKFQVAAEQFLKRSQLEDESVSDGINVLWLHELFAPSLRMSPRLNRSTIGGGR